MVAWLVKRTRALACVRRRPCTIVIAMTRGQQLAEKLMMYANRPDVLVLALPRGGVPVGFAVAEGLHAPLDVFLVNVESPTRGLAMGAIATGGVRVLKTS